MSPPSPANLILAVTFLLSAIVCAGLSVPLIRGQVPMNRWYGVRTPKAYTSKSNWFELNRVGGWQLLWYSVAIGVVGILLFLVPLSAERWYFWPLLLSPLWLLVPVLWRIFAVSRRLP